MAGSGNTLQAITGLASNLANQEYGSYLDRLQGLSGQGLSAAGSMSGNNALAGNYQYGGAGTLAGILSNAGTSLAGLDQNQAPGMGNLQSGLGSAMGNLDTSLGNSLTDNSWKVTDAVNGASLAAARAQDATNSNNNSIFSSLFSGGLNLLGGTASGGALKSAFNKL